MVVTPVVVVLVSFVGGLALIAATYLVQRGFARLGRGRPDLG